MAGILGSGVESRHRIGKETVFLRVCNHQFKRPCASSDVTIKKVLLGGGRIRVGECEREDRDAGVPRRFNAEERRGEIGSGVWGRMRI